MLNLNLEENKKIGVMFSGGVDSTLLLYLLCKQGIDKNCTIVPFTIPRLTGALDYAYSIIDYFDYMFEIDLQETNIVGKQNDPHEIFVGYGIAEAMNYDVDYIYIGSTKNPDIEIEGAPKRFKYNYYKVKQPFFDLSKYEIVKMYYDLGIQDLLRFTHSCSVQKIGECGECFFCKEKNWALTKLNHEYDK